MVCIVIYFSSGERWVVGWDDELWILDDLLLLVLLDNEVGITALGEGSAGY